MKNHKIAKNCIILTPTVYSTSSHFAFKNSLWKLQQKSPVQYTSLKNIWAYKLHKTPSMKNYQVISDGLPTAGQVLTLQDFSLNWRGYQKANQSSTWCMENSINKHNNAECNEACIQARESNLVISKTEGSTTWNLTVPGGCKCSSKVWIVTIPPTSKKSWPHD